MALGVLLGLGVSELDERLAISLPLFEFAGGGTARRDPGEAVYASPDPRPLLLGRPRPRREAARNGLVARDGTGAPNRGAEAEAVATAYLTSYYAWLGAEIAAGAAADAARVRTELDAFEAGGCGELILLPCDANPAQVDLLADAAL